MGDEPEYKATMWDNRKRKIAFTAPPEIIDKLKEFGVVEKVEGAKISYVITVYRWRKFVDVVDYINNQSRA